MILHLASHGAVVSLYLSSNGIGSFHLKNFECFSDIFYMYSIVEADRNELPNR